MKKKLLSLVLAGAMVASTSVSAFADDTTTISSYKEGSNTANVTIKGSVDNNKGESAAGTISVSVPTVLNFKVDKSGTVSGGKINITNNGTDAVDVTAFKFKDNTPETKITVKVPGQLNAESDTRAKMVLSIGGNQVDRAYFKTEDAASGQNGIYNEQGTNQSEGIKVSRIEGDGGTDTLALAGFAGKADLENGEGTDGVTDEFILTLKIAKATN